MDELEQEFEDKLADLTGEYLSKGVPVEAIVSAMDMRKMIIEEDEAGK